MFTHFKYENQKSKKKDKKYKVLSTKLKTNDTFVNIARISTSGTLSTPGFSLMVISIPTEVACGLTLTKKSFIWNIYEYIKIIHKRFWESSTN